MPREQVFEILRKSDVFILTSNWEGFPRTILEAMSCGLAVIASNVGGVKEAINGNCGILVEKSSKEAVKKALEQLLKNPFLIREMGERAKARAEKEFSLERMLERTGEVYTTILGD